MIFVGMRQLSSIRYWACVVLSSIINWAEGGEQENSGTEGEGEGRSWMALSFVAASLPSRTATRLLSGP